jgi:hypothetical protein
MMYWRDHSPPHFHAKYAEYEVEVEIRTGRATGRMPRRALQMIEHWRKAHVDEMIQDWGCATDGGVLAPIQPLE